MIILVSFGYFFIISNYIFSFSFFDFSNPFNPSSKLKKISNRSEIDESSLIELNRIDIDSESISRLKTLSNDEKSLKIASNHLIKRKQLEISDSIKEIRIIVKNIKSAPFKLIIDYSSLDSISQSIIEWIIKMKRIKIKNDEFEKAIDPIRSIIEIIKQKIISLNHSFTFNYNIKNENNPTIKLLTLFNYLNNSEYSLVSIIEKFCNFHSDIELFKLILENKSFDYDLFRVQAINDSIFSNYQSINFIQLSKIIGEYDQNEGLKYAIDKLMTNPNISKEKSKLDFYSRTFVKDLIPIIRNIVISNDNNNFCWYNLRRLLFK